MNPIYIELALEYDKAADITIVDFNEFINIGKIYFTNVIEISYPNQIYLSDSNQLSERKRTFIMNVNQIAISLMVDSDVKIEDEIEKLSNFFDSVLKYFKIDEYKSLRLDLTTLLNSTTTESFRPLIRDLKLTIPNKLNENLKGEKLSLGLRISVENTSTEYTKVFSFIIEPNFENPAFNYYNSSSTITGLIKSADILKQTINEYNYNIQNVIPLLEGAE